jgi:2-polyprenyl-3-methyl-5-hydroxy-6-metoxy-1,4-benzoquinol methylase
VSGAFDAVAADLAAAIPPHLSGELSEEARSTTIATNTSLVARRAELLVGLVRSATDLGDLGGRRVLDAGAGFGAIALYLAAEHGAEVVCVDMSRERLAVAEEVAAAHGLPIAVVAGRMERVARVVTGPFDLAVLNNSLVYLVDPATRAAALAGVRSVLRPGGWAIKRDANRLQPVDPFSRLPLVHLLAPQRAVRAAARAGRHRSAVRMTSPAGARRELLDAGFANVRVVGSRLPVGRYHHVVGRRAA